MYNRILKVVLLLMVSMMILPASGCFGRYRKGDRHNDAPVEEKGTIVEKLDAGRYTYVRVALGKKDVWLVAPKADVKEGDEIKFKRTVPIENLKSSSLNRTFKEVYFLNRFGDPPEPEICEGDELPGDLQVVEGKVLDVKDASRYTYIHVETSKGKVWFAAPQFKVKKGDDVMMKKGSLMKDFFSKTLYSRFSNIYFTSKILVKGKPHESQPPKPQPVKPDGHPDSTR